MSDPTYRTRMRRLAVALAMVLVAAVSVDDLRGGG
jgi:hypothetical protein